MTAPGTGAPAAATAIPDADGKCRAVKHGHVNLHCTLPAGHDRPSEGQPATWHEAVYADHREISYDGARHVFDATERVTWEPVDHVAEATRHLMAGRRRDQ